MSGEIALEDLPDLPFYLRPAKLRVLVRKQPGRLADTPGEDPQARGTAVRLSRPLCQCVECLSACSV